MPIRKKKKLRILSLFLTFILLLTFVFSLNISKNEFYGEEKITDLNDKTIVTPDADYYETAAASFEALIQKHANSEPTLSPLMARSTPHAGQQIVITYDPAVRADAFCIMFKSSAFYNNGVGQTLMFAMWNSDYGQDDMIWYQNHILWGESNWYGSMFQYYAWVDINAHGAISGTAINCHAYTQDATGMHMVYGINNASINPAFSLDLSGGSWDETVYIGYGQLNHTPPSIYIPGLSPTGCLPWRTGYTLTSVYDDFTQTAYDPANWIKFYYNTLNFVLRCIWSPNTYTISFNSNGGSATTSSIPVTYDTSNYYIITSAVPAPTRTGYSFTGWFTAPSGGTRIYNPDGYCNGGTDYWSLSSTWIHPADITLYAQWEKNQYTISYNANGGSTKASSKTLYYGDAVDLSPTATKAGYTFVGWGLSPNDTKPLTSLTMPADNVTLYALYSIQVSDVANHTYPSYNKEKDNEVHLTVTNSSGARKTYPLVYQTDAGIMFYTYQLNNTSLASHVGNNNYKYQIVAYDNAGNYSILLHGGHTVPEPVYYWQTVEHYKYNQAEGKWEYITTTSDNVLEGSKYTPSYISPPAGYKKDHIDGAYTVTGTKTSKAYYTPNTYTLSFHPNGGSVSPTSKNIVFGDYYGEMPTPILKGHSFNGWFTKASGGAEVSDTTIYTTAGNTTVYAHWTPNSYKVTYDYMTNGGTSASKESASLVYNNAIDLSVTANKEGWMFVGWNTNPDVTTGLSSLKISDEDVTLYAIFKKDLTATFVDGLNQTTNTITKTIYNRATSCKITTRPITELEEWKTRGWSFNTEGDAAIHVSPNVEYEMHTNTTFYACYVQDITLSYDTNGSANEIPSQTEERFYNASGNYKNPTFITANGPTLDKHTFVQWEELDANGSVLNQYPEKTTITVDHTTTLTAKWDQHPVIEAYDRYFTLEEAQNGEITQKRLLEKVTATDREDGVLENGTDVIVRDYIATDFTDITTDTELDIIYRATDSFGNITEKHITLHVIDTSIKESKRISYPRFISNTFLEKNSEYIPSEYGGLSANSIWKNNPVYQQLLSHTLQREEPILIWTFSTQE